MGYLMPTRKITVTEDVWGYLNQLKEKWGLESPNQVIRELIRRVESCGTSLRDDIVKKLEDLRRSHSLSTINDVIALLLDRYDVAKIFEEFECRRCAVDIITKLRDIAKPLWEVIKVPGNMKKPPPWVRTRVEDALKKIEELIHELMPIEEEEGEE